jgi:hypothetical protein
MIVWESRPPKHIFGQLLGICGLCGGLPEVTGLGQNRRSRPVRQISAYPLTAALSDIPQPLLEPEAEVRRRNNLLILVRVQIALLSLKLQFR